MSVNIIMFHVFASSDTVLYYWVIIVFSFLAQVQSLVFKQFSTLVDVKNRRNSITCSMAELPVAQILMTSAVT